MTKCSIQSVFSNTNLEDSDKRRSNTVVLQTSIYMSKPSDPTKSCPFNTNPNHQNSNQTFHYYYGIIITCHDYQSIEYIKANLFTSPAKTTRLLLNAYAKQHPTLIDHQYPIKIFIMLNIKKYLIRSIQINMSWCKKLSTLASRAHMIAFAGVYYSVLGGAYCSLGKANTKYAYKAGALAIKQIKLAKRLKDPVLECKCWLYFAEDLLQLGKVKKAKSIIESQIKFVESTGDLMLSSMLEAVKSKIKIPVK